MTAPGRPTKASKLFASIPQHRISVTKIAVGVGGHTSTSTSQLHLPLPASAPNRNTKLPPVQPPTSDSGHVDDTACQVSRGQKNVCYENSDDPMAAWLPYRNKYLDYLVELEVFSSPTLTCSDCSAVVGTAECPAIRCMDCFGDHISCSLCCVCKHHQHPLHRIEEFSGEFFCRSSLKGIGLVVMFGHEECPAPVRGSKDFIVIHTNGLHDIAASFCGCHNAAPRYAQILLRSWYPATPEYPETAVTFDVLQLYHFLSVQSKISNDQFYASIARLKDNTGLNPPPDRYSTFLRLVHQWRHLKMLKRGGRAHDSNPEHISATALGALALKCPACPQPGINLPKNWQSEPQEKQFRNRLFIGLDGNFKLQNQLRPGMSASLGPGWAYFVAPAAYQSFVHSQGPQTEISTCSGLSAVDHANTKKSHGLRSTGVMMCCCVRHGLVLPCGIGDLQKGERYANTDYIVASALFGTTVTHVLISYDIACQWSRNLKARLERLPDEIRTTILQLVINDGIEVAIPKFHLPAHKVECHSSYSLNYRTGAGRVDGEAPEQVWSSINGAANSTKEMKGGHRHDTLDDIINDINWRKLLQMATTLASKLVEAKLKSQLHSEEFQVFSENLGPVTREGWNDMIINWENDRTLPDPFLVKNEFKTQIEVRKELLELEQRCPLWMALPTNTMVTKFLVTALEIEDTQQSIRTKAKALSSPPTPYQLAELEEKRLALTKQIVPFRKLQHAVQPDIRNLLDADDEKNPEDIDILIPSSLVALGLSTLVNPALSDMEARLRYAQLTDTLSSLCRALSVVAELTRYKHKEARGVGMNTRAQSLINSAQKKVRECVSTYRCSRLAYLAIRGRGEWEQTLRELHDEDVRSLSSHQDESVMQSRDGPREGQRIVSWIYTTGGATELSTPEFNQALRVEYAKSRARAHRWREEVIILEAEMERTALFFKYMASLWLERANLCRADASDSRRLIDGLRAYARCQAHLYEKLGERAEHLRQNLPSKKRRGGEVQA